MAEHLSDPTHILGPECRDRKHANCDGRALKVYADGTDMISECDCPCHVKVPKVAAGRTPEVRYATLVNGETELDEVVARGASVHLEAMEDNHWWLAIEAGGQRWVVNLYTKRAKITAVAELEDEEVPR